MENIHQKYKACRSKCKHMRGNQNNQNSSSEADDLMLKGVQAHLELLGIWRCGVTISLKLLTLFRLFFWVFDSQNVQQSRACVTQHPPMHQLEKACFGFSFCMKPNSALNGVWVSFEKKT
jgi:hypothetical protein